MEMEGLDKTATDLNFVAHTAEASSNVQYPAVSERNCLQSEMFDRIVNSPGAYFRSQQRGEPDLENTEKLEIVRGLYSNNQTKFLYYYRKYLTGDDLQWFEANADNYEQTYYLKETANRTGGMIRSDSNADQMNISNKLNSTSSNALRRKRNSNSICSNHGESSILVKNRRYIALRDLVQKGKYFSDAEMRARQPVLYDQMITRYISQQEYSDGLHAPIKNECAAKSIDPRAGTEDNQPHALSSMMLTFCDAQQVSARLREQQLEQAMQRLDHDQTHDSSESDVSEDEDDRPAMHDDCGHGQGDNEQVVEVDSDSDEQISTGTDPTAYDNGAGPDANKSGSGRRRPKRVASPNERVLLREEFIAIMQENFLSGKDSEHFDYSQVDSNEQFDPIDILSRDAEDDYFDSEAESIACES